METTTQPPPPPPPPPSTPPECCYYNYSTGYLEDVLIQFSLRFKRQRPLSPQNSISDFQLWTKNCSDQTINFESFSGYSKKDSKFEEVIVENKQIEEVIETSCFSTESSSISAYQDENAIVKSVKNEETTRKLSSSSRKRKSSRRVVTYPFAMVKPGGIEGDLTLDDINKRIRMPPSRPVRHPVGDYACHPCVVSPHGPGLSGKPVVALTRILTQGNGTITIIRTKG